MFWLLGSIAGLIISMVSFVLGRVFAQSETILSEKRRVYEEFLRACPKPNDSYTTFDQDQTDSRFDQMMGVYAVLMFYAAPSVAHAIKHYLGAFAEADQQLNPESAALHPSYQRLAMAHNDIILEMRRDALGWSMFGYHGKSRLPTDKAV
jgi:hypothetical protein